MALQLCMCYLYSFLTSYIVNSVNIRIQTNVSVAQTDDNFVAMAIDSGIIRRGWDRVGFSTAKVQTLARGLSPCYLRVGGTSADFLIFEPGKTSRNPNVKVITKRDVGVFFDLGKKHYTNFTMTGEVYDELHSFSKAVGWNLVFDLNVLLQTNGGQWDPSNAVQLIKYSQQKQYKLAGWELGNEPNAFFHIVKRRIEPEQLSADYRRLRDILNTFPDYKDSIIIGPSTTQLDKKHVDKYFQQFLQSGGRNVVTEATFHFYYLNGRNASASDFLDPDILDILLPELLTANQIINQSAPGLRVWIGETSSAYGGGARGLSDAYISGFLWMNTMGVSARQGVAVVVRQAFYGGHYSVLDTDSLDPNPDYWLILLYKQLVGPKVLAVTSPDRSDGLRVFAHCTSKRSGYKPGTVVVYFMNLNKKEENVTFPDFSPNTNIDVFLLEPHHGKLNSRLVLLNGKVLKMKSDTELPPLKPVKQTIPLTIPGQSFGFLVLTGKTITACTH